MSIMDPRPPAIFDWGMHNPSTTPLHHGSPNSALQPQKFPPSPPTTPPIKHQKQPSDAFNQSPGSSPLTSHSNSHIQSRRDRNTSPPSRIPFSQRLIKPTPFQQSRDGGKEKRRDLFLKKMKQESEERRWDSRAEHYLRLDYISDRKRWEAELARSAPPVLDEEAAEEGQQTDNIEMAAEDISQYEDEQISALPPMMVSNPRDNEDSWTTFGSDDDEYDALFMEVAGPQQQAQFLAAPPQEQKDQEMDTSNG
ncbi:hypothetical protein L228DRAFT_81763 [Xylona heveae TC161]|uniref:Uncharacterized protein n=1 Tax=Xylona heveae (strain CBS 132557 / TC161) TaxID=1328760 RepID=A0A165J3L7_XYLHT|nr:hypothetical protein L228DRAFT_81763 [Xylona heveae TC161]KZF25684.1 hypothetical protein L228DRAFT_81763 [Xylona heveae TC161]